MFGDGPETLSLKGTSRESLDVEPVYLMEEDENYWNALPEDIPIPESWISE